MGEKQDTSNLKNICRTSFEAGRNGRIHSHFALLTTYYSAKLTPSGPMIYEQPALWAPIWRGQSAEGES